MVEPDTDRSLLSERREWYVGEFGRNGAYVGLGLQKDQR